jgi:hypothetical protein
LSLYKPLITWRGGGSAPFIIKLGTRWRLAVSFTLLSLYWRGRAPSYLLNRKLVGLQTVWTPRRRNKSLANTGNGNTIRRASSLQRRSHYPRKLSIGVVKCFSKGIDRRKPTVCKISEIPSQNKRILSKDGDKTEFSQTPARNRNESINNSTLCNITLH